MSGGPSCTLHELAVLGQMSAIKAADMSPGTNSCSGRQQQRWQCLLQFAGGNHFFGGNVLLQQNIRLLQRLARRAIGSIPLPAHSHHTRGFCPVQQHSGLEGAADSGCDRKKQCHIVGFEDWSRQDSAANSGVVCLLLRPSHLTYDGIGRAHCLCRSLHNACRQHGSQRSGVQLCSPLYKDEQLRTCVILISA